MSKINSKIKGKRGELDAVHFIKSMWKINARRSQQYMGSPQSSDILTDVELFHFEIKRTERLNIRKAMDQAEKDAGKNQIPIVMHRPSNKEWHITIRARDAVFFSEQLLAAKGNFDHQDGNDNC